MKDRHLELSAKLIEMGNALMIEGTETNDYYIRQTGNMIIFLGQLLLTENDIRSFAELASMFSAKKILQNMEANKSEFFEYFKKKVGDESYDEFIKKINKFREDNGHTPIL